MIPAYFAQIKNIIDEYGSANFVLDTNLTVENRPGSQGYLYGLIIFVEGSRFYFREYLKATTDSIYKIDYSYHYQDADNHLIFRYDNAAHKPALGYAHHKHVGDTEIIQIQPLTLSDVLSEITLMHK